MITVVGAGGRLLAAGCQKLRRYLLVHCATTVSLMRRLPTTPLVQKFGSKFKITQQQHLSAQGSLHVVAELPNTNSLKETRSFPDDPSLPVVTITNSV